MQWARLNTEIRDPITHALHTIQIPINLSQVKWGSTIPSMALTNILTCISMTKMYWKSLSKKGILPGTSGCHTSSPDFYPSPTAYGQAAYAGYPGYSYPANTNSIASK